MKPGKPWQNGIGKRFNGSFRDECLDREWFHTRSEARVVIEQYRRHYNEERPHSSLGYQTPAEVGGPPGLAPGSRHSRVGPHPATECVIIVGPRNGRKTAMTRCHHSCQMSTGNV